MQEKFYITTAIDYPSAAPHLGHAYEKLTADVIARWKRLEGKNVFFLTGTDEHGLKIQRKALELNLKPKEFVDLNSAKFLELVKTLNISNDFFIRTTDERHEKLCIEFFKKVFDKGDIYLGDYEGDYCAECETFYLKKDLINDCCPIHKKKTERIKEKTYFFKLSKYKKQILDYLKKDDCILPKAKKQEIINRLKNELHDLSVSRTTFDWGIKIPFNEKHVIYVWFDALLNYVTALKINNKFNEFWPADIHLIGNDIVWHHSVIWWAMLLSLGFELPKTIFVHGFINTESGEKMSKSKGNIIDPIDLTKKYNVDALRYFLIREIPFGEDGFFSEKKLIERNNNELANELGNLVFRALTLIEKKNNSLIPEAKTSIELQKKLHLNKIINFMNNFELHLALTEIMSFVKECNRFVNEKKPWQQTGNALNETLYSLADSLRIIAILLQPFMPSTSEKIFMQLNIKPQKLSECNFNLTKANTKIKKSEILFKKIN